MKNSEIASMANDIIQQTSVQQGEIILYQPDETVRLEVRIEDETVWLSQAQMGELFGTNRQAITKHLQNIYDTKELRKEATSSILELVRKEGKRNVRRKIEFYNLDAIISVGFRVNTKRGIEFRQWANQVLKDFLLRGHAINTRFQALEKQVAEQGSQLQVVKEKIDFFVRTSLPPVEGIFFEGQIFDAYKLVEDLIKDATREIILIDNYIDAHIFDLLEQRGQGVTATIYTERVTPALQHTQQLCTTQHDRTVGLRTYSTRFHDRFLIIDDTVYHFGASFKDLGRRLFAFTRMEAEPAVILSQL